ncbi:MAG: MBOAT family protein [Verrucomicrobia bacterium]|nr:MBOAT family protein [Verrucomicrobiota bacterium]
MYFDTPVYFVFLTLITLAYWRLQWRAQNVLLVAASYFFYGWWNWRFLFLMGGSTLVDYFLAAQIAKSSDARKRRLFLVVSLVMNFGFLGAFKYFNFFIDSFSHVAGWFGHAERLAPVLRIVLPAGISFYTFQAVAYIVDVYHRKMEPARSLLDYALFISFFPHLVAGPIQRPAHLLPQTQSPRTFDAGRVFDGLMLIVTGLFRKCVVADNCALLANGVFNGNLGELNLPLVLLGTYAFAWQIYGDFSGYSDIARGSAQLLGFHFMVNFRQPYLATSLSDLWRRWHISLSTWLRDYLYIPLGGNRHGEANTQRNLFLTMLLGGLWHGANWTFVIWGALHGAGLAVARWLGFQPETSARENAATSFSTLKRWLARIAVFHFVCLGWIFFRATSVNEAFRFLQGLARPTWLPQYWIALQFLAIFTVPLFLLDLRLERFQEEYPFEKLKPFGGALSYRRRAIFAACLLLAVLIFAATEPSAFIYFQF